MTRKTHHISILQFDERLISRLRVRRSTRGVDVLAFDQERGAWSLEDGSLEAALEAFAQSHALADDDVYTVLPRHEMTARILELPTEDPDEIAGGIRLSAEEYVPFPADELIIDQCVLRTLPDGASLVLAVFAHHDVVDQHLALLGSAGIEPIQIFLSTTCLASASAAAEGGKQQRHALVNLASGGLEVVVMNAKRLEYGRAVASAQDWGLRGDEAAEVLEELRVEIGASLSAYRRQSEDGEGVDAVYLCSEWADVSGYGEALVHELGQDCAPATFARGLLVGGGEAVATLPLVSLGAALTAQGRGVAPIRLLPGSVLESRKRSGLKGKAIRLGALAAAVLIALTGLYAVLVRQRQAYIRELRARIAKVEPRAKSVVAKTKQLQIIEQQVERAGSVIELLAALCDAFPASGINVTRFVFTHNQEIELYGRAENLEILQALTQDLIDMGKTALPQFAMTQRAYENKVRERNQTVLDYKLIMPFPISEAAEGGGENVE